MRDRTPYLERSPHGALDLTSHPLEGAEGHTPMDGGVGAAGSRAEGDLTTMTSTQWLTHFTDGAARLPGWQLLYGSLRRVERDEQQCPLRAQWNFSHPRQQCQSNSPSLLRVLWAPVLTEAAIARLLTAADVIADATDPAPRRALRAQLLAACGVQEGL